MSRARAEYMAAYRAANPDFTDRANARQAARNAALRQLAARHPAEYEELFKLACERAGVDAPALTRPCACGGVIVRTSPAGRWPATCGSCP